MLSGVGTEEGKLEVLWGGKEVQGPCTPNQRGWKFSLKYWMPVGLFLSGKHSGLFSEMHWASCRAASWAFSGVVPTARSK